MWYVGSSQRSRPAFTSVVIIPSNHECAMIAVLAWSCFTIAISIRNSGAFARLSQRNRLVAPFLADPNRQDVKKQ